MVQAAAQHGVRLRGLSEYYMARLELCCPNTVVAGYSALKEDDIPAVAAALAEAWCSFEPAFFEKKVGKENFKTLKLQRGYTIFRVPFD